MSHSNYQSFYCNGYFDEDLPQLRRLRAYVYLEKLEFMKFIWFRKNDIYESYFQWIPQELFEDCLGLLINSNQCDWEFQNPVGYEFNFGIKLNKKPSLNPYVRAYERLNNYGYEYIEANLFNHGLYETIRRC
jgi:hypothetical protein